jgi:hypothetical protein
LFADVEAQVEELKASETDIKNLFYRKRMPTRYLSMIISSWPMSVVCTWSFGSPRTVTLSTAINLCRSLMKTARNCGANSRSLKKPHCPSQNC